MITVPESQALLSNPDLLASLLREAQGVNIDVLDGVAAGTKMNVPAMRTGDTIRSAIVFNDTFAPPTQDKANISIVPTTATGTLTFSGNPVAGETLVVNGNTYTFRAVPTKINEVLITTGNNNAMAASLAAAINAYESRYESALNGDGNRTPGVAASAAAAVVTVRSRVDGPGNAPTITGTATRFTIVGSGTGSVTVTSNAVVATNTVVVNGITFTASAAPTGDVQFAVRGTDALQAAEVARVINAYQFKYTNLGVKAVAVGAVVTVTPSTAPTGNAISLTEGATNVAASGTGYLTGGTLVGGVTSTTNLATATLLLMWYKA